MAKNNGTVQKSTEGKKGLDLNDFFSGIAESDEVKKVEVSKVSVFHGDIIKTIGSIGVTNVLKFVAPKEWTEENVRSLANLFEAVRTKKNLYKKTDVSSPFQRKDGLWCISFESSDAKEFKGNDKMPGLGQTLRFIIENENFMGTEFPRGSIRYNKVAKVGFSFEDENGPFQVGEKGLFGFFIVNDLMRPTSINKKTGKIHQNHVNAEMLVNITGLSENIQMSTNFPRDGRTSLSIKNFKFDDSVMIRRSITNTLYIVCFDILDFETVEEQYTTKKGKTATKTVKYPKIGYHICTITIDPSSPNGYRFDNRTTFENDGISAPANLEYVLADIINSKLDKRFKTWCRFDQDGNPERDEEGKVINHLVSDRIIEETNLSSICARIDEVLEAVEKNKVEVVGEEDCIFARRVKYQKPYTFGDALNESAISSEEYSDEEGEAETEENEVPSQDDQNESPTVEPEKNGDEVED